LSISFIEASLFFLSWIMFPFFFSSINVVFLSMFSLMLVYEFNLFQ
jgi:hypothetical protein